MHWLGSPSRTVVQVRRLQCEQQAASFRVVDAAEICNVLKQLYYQSTVLACASLLGPPRVSVLFLCASVLHKRVCSCLPCAADQPVLVEAIGSRRVIRHSASTVSVGTTKTDVF
jgi:hypothetical protein